MLFYCPTLLYSYGSLLLFFLFSSFCLMYFFRTQYCGAGVFGLTGCISLSLSLALPTFFNNKILIIINHEYINLLD